MKIRYYLRGLGLGILFTAVFFLLSGDSEQTMSDEMIIERAKELGMIENTVLVDIAESTVEMDESIESTVIEKLDDGETEYIAAETIEEIETLETITEESVSVEENTESETVEDLEESSEAEESKEPEVVLEEPESAESSEEETVDTSEGTPIGQLVSIMVNKGEGSDTVSHRLYEAGLVEDAYEYDRYLMQNGYDKRIGAGEHLIPAGASWQEIAQILTS